MYSFCIGVWPFAFLILPILNLIARAGLDKTTGELGTTTVASLWIGIAFVLMLSKVACLAYSYVFVHCWLVVVIDTIFSVSMILIKENAPNAASLGQSNGIVQFAMCFARSFAPFVVRYVCPSRAGLLSCSSSALFSISTEYNLLAGQLWLAIMMTVSFLGMKLSRKIEQHSVKTIG
jgi:hypothetical protein